MTTAPSVALDTKKVAELQESNSALAEQASDCDVTDEDGYLAAGAMLDLVLKRKDIITKFFEEPAKNANALHKWITQQRSISLAPLEQADTMLRSRRQVWRTAEEKKRRDVEDQERKKAKEELEKLAVQEAAVMESMGETAAATEIIERAVAAPAPAVMVRSTIPKEKGKSYRKVYTYRVVNKAEIKEQFKIPDDSAIKALVDRLGPDAALVVGGIEVEESEVEVVRRQSSL